MPPDCRAPLLSHQRAINLTIGARPAMRQETIDGCVKALLKPDVVLQA
jgi:hypothetical protein